jgi:uncharacterized protein (TIGR00251 family)
LVFTGGMNSGPIWTSERGTFLRVIVKPNSKEKQFVGEISSDSIQINLTGPAREGKANTELVKKLSKLLDVSTSSIQLIAGHKSREKILLIDGLASEDVENRLST